MDALPRGHPDRSPSPPPIYDRNGRLKNTRAKRWKEKYGEERIDCLEQILNIIPSANATAVLGKRQRSRKIRIPVEEYPTYNFIGLIIGPRGKTQKELESKTGCKIAIRGKGSVKEGARGRQNSQPMEGADEPLHVVVTGDDPKGVDEAAKIIESMLVVIDDEKNVHKQAQLRELALLNGTLKEDDWCTICGDKGHKDFECPKRFALNSKSKVQIKCSLCGETSHPTRDCPLRKAGLAEGTEGGDQKQLDSDYSAFMAELDGRTCLPAPKGEEKTAGVDGITGGGAGSSLSVVQEAKADDPLPAMTSTGTSFVTTISSAKEVDPLTAGSGSAPETTETLNTPGTAETLSAPLPPQPPGVAPPGIPPPGVAPPGVAPPGLAPPGVAPPGVTFPHPPANNLPPPPHGMPPPMGQQPPAYPPNQQWNQYGQYGAQQGQQQQQNGWNPNAYYGQGYDQGAGGFNWWE